MEPHLEGCSVERTGRCICDYLEKWLDDPEGKALVQEILARKAAGVRYITDWSNRPAKEVAADAVKGGLPGGTASGPSPAPREDHAA